MKKVLFTLLCAFLFSTSIYAVKELVPLTVSIEEDDQPIGHGAGRPSIEVPLVYIDDYTLTFEAYHPDYAFKTNKMQMKQVINHNKGGGLLNMIRRTDPGIFLAIPLNCTEKQQLI